MERLIVVLLAVLVAGCNTYTVKNSRIASTVQGKEFNSLASTYYDRPTHLSVSEMSDGWQILKIEMDRYGSPRVNPKATAYLSSQYADSYIAAIDKYFDWEKQAFEYKDIVDKKIDAFPALAGLTQQVSFYSGNEVRHYLVLELCTLGICDNQILLDRDSAEALKAELVALKNGSLKVGLKGTYE